MDYRGKKEKKFNFKEKKQCAIRSLREVNCFLSKLNKACSINNCLKKF